MFAKKTFVIAAATVMTALSAGTARAGDVSWSIGIHAPIAPGAVIGTVISNRPVTPVVVAPPVVYRPAPVVYAPPRPLVLPAPVVHARPPVYVPRRVVMAPVWVHGRWVHPAPHGRAHRDHGGWRDDRGHWDRDDDRRGPPAHEPQRGRR